MVLYIYRYIFGSCCCFLKYVCVCMMMFALNTAYFVWGGNVSSIIWLSADLVRKYCLNLNNFKATPVGNIAADMLKSAIYIHFYL